MESKNNEVFGPAMVILAAVLYRAMFTASWFKGLFVTLNEWGFAAIKPTISITNFWGWIEYGLLVAAVIWVLSDGRNMEHRFAKALAILIVFVSILLDNLAFAKGLMLAFLVFSVAEWLLKDRGAVKSNNPYLVNYTKDWIIIVLVLAALGANYAVVNWLPNEARIAASIVPLILLVMVAMFISFGNDPYNKMVQWAILVVAIPLLFTDYAGCILYYWFLLNLGLKVNEFVYRQDFLSKTLADNQ